MTREDRTYILEGITSARFYARHNREQARYARARGEYAAANRWMEQARQEAIALLVESEAALSMGISEAAVRRAGGIIENRQEVTA